MVGALLMAALPHVPGHVIAASPPALSAYSVPTGFGYANSASDPTTGHTFIAGDGQVVMADSASGIVLRRTSIGHGQQRVFVDSTRGRVVIYSDGGTGTASVSTISAATGLAVRTVYLNTEGLTGPMVQDQTTGRFFVGDWTWGPAHLDFVICVIDTWTGMLLRRLTDPDTAYSAYMAGDEASGRVLVLTSASPVDSYKLTVLDSSSGNTLATQDLQMTSDGADPPLFTLDSAAGHALIAEESGLAMRDIRDGMLLSKVDVQADLVLPDDAAGTLVAVNGSTIDLIDQSSGSLLQTVTLPLLSGLDGANGGESVAVDAQSGYIYALTQNGAGRLELQVLDGADGATVDSIDLRQPAGSGAVAADATHQRLAIIAQPGDGLSPVFIDVDTGSDTVVAQAGTPCLTGGYSGAWQMTADPYSGRFYCVDLGDDAVGLAPAVYAWDLETGQSFTPLTLSGMPQSAQLIGASGYLMVPQDTTVTIVGPERHTPAGSAPQACCGAQYFPSARHNLRGPFLTFWRRYGGVDIFGYPQTEPFVEDGRTVQYTDRFVLEMVNGRVQTAPLDRYLVAQRYFDPANVPAAGPGVRYFPNTQHSLSGRFLTWWLAHQGKTLLGAPISEPLVEGNGDGSGRRYLLQWFQKGRLEYHPEHAGTRYEMQLGLVGLQALQQRGWKS
jgi:hypothetical protein